MPQAFQLSVILRYIRLVGDPRSLFERRIASSPFVRKQGGTFYLAHGSLVLRGANMTTENENRESEGLFCLDQAARHVAHRGYNGGRLFLWCKAWAVGWGDDFAPGAYIDWNGIAGVGDRCAERVV